MKTREQMLQDYHATLDELTVAVDIMKSIQLDASHISNAIEIRKAQEQVRRLAYTAWCYADEYKEDFCYISQF